MQNTQNYQAVARVVGDQVNVPAIPKEPVYKEAILVPDAPTPALPREMTERDFINYVMEKQKTMFAEQEHNVKALKEMQSPFFGPVAPIFWILIGVVLYATISKVIENKRYFLDFVDRMWVEIGFLRREDTETEAQIKRINKRLENLEEKVVYYERGANYKTPGLGFDFPEFQKGVEK